MILLFKLFAAVFRRLQTSGAPTVCWYICSFLIKWKISSISEKSEVEQFPLSAALKYSLNIVIWTLRWSDLISNLEP